MVIKNIIRKAIIPLDSITKDIKMNTTKSINSTTKKIRKVIIRNMAPNMNSTNIRKAITRKAKNMIPATTKDTMVCILFLLTIFPNSESNFSSICY